MKDEALKMALEDYMIREMPAGTVIGDPKWWAGKIANAIKQALAAPTVQEPVGTYGEIFKAMTSLLGSGNQRDQQIYMAMQHKPLYTTPPAAQRQWVGLTDEEMYLNCPNWLSHEQCKTWVQQIETKLKEKNI
jgi:hypothetical protein